jgi:GntR family transcriptional regulator, transcriptional repressor for pyruvate dehydrogenase complex
MPSFWRSGVTHVVHEAVAGRLGSAQKMRSPITASTATGVHAPKAAQIVVRTLRRLIANGELKAGDFLPNEAKLIDQFAVSRATLREAVRLLEADGLIEVRPGARTGARVLLPGPEIVARSASLLLQVSGATIGDVMAARAGIEPIAAKLLAQLGTPSEFNELDSIFAEKMSPARDVKRLTETTSEFHRRLVDLSGNVTLSIMAGMLDEITERNASAAPRTRGRLTQNRRQQLLSPYRRLIVLLRARDGTAAEAHWRHHIDTVRDLLPPNHVNLKVRATS